MRPDLPNPLVPEPQLPKRPEDDVYLRVTLLVLTTAAELDVPAAPAAPAAPVSPAGPAAPAGPAGPWEPVSPGAPKTVELSLPEHFFTDASRMTPVVLLIQTRCPSDEAVARSARGVNALPIVMPPTKSSIPAFANRFI